MIIYGINPVLEGLRAGRVTAVRIADRQSDRLQAIVALAASRHVPVEYVTPDALARQSRGGVHQGVVADIADRVEHSIEDLVRGAAAAPLLVVLDGI